MNSDSISDIQKSNGCVARRAWEQTPLPDAVPVWSWTDIKVLETRQTGLLEGGPSNLITAVMDAQVWSAIKDSTCR